MMKKSEMEMKYERYKDDPDSIKEIDGILYYKAVDKYGVDKKYKLVVITLPLQMFGNTIPGTIRDSRGNTFHLGLPAHIRFIDYVPEWYRECVHCEVLDADRVEDLGEYFTCVIENE